MGSKLASHLKPLVDSGRSSLLPIYNTTLSRLIALGLEIAHDLQVCSRVKWVEEATSSSAFFLRLIKRQSVDRNIAAQRADDGSAISDQDGLCRLLRPPLLKYFSATPCDPASQADLLSNVSAKFFSYPEYCLWGPSQSGRSVLPPAGHDSWQEPWLWWPSHGILSTFLVCSFWWSGSCSELCFCFWFHVSLALSVVVLLLGSLTPSRSNECSGHL